MVNTQSGKNLGLLPKDNKAAQVVSLWASWDPAAPSVKLGYSSTVHTS